MKSQSDLEGNFLFGISSPPTKDGTWFGRELQNKDNTCKIIHAEIICQECKKKPPHVQILCDHKKPRGNKLKSSKVRKSEQNSSGDNIKAVLIEGMGFSKEQNSCFYPDGDLNELFSPKNFKSPPSIPGFYIACFDPNAGGANHTAFVGGTVVQGKFYICCVDDKRTIEFKDYCLFIVENIEKLHDIHRKDNRIPIVLIIESQTSWNGDTMKDIIDTLSGSFVHSTKFKNVHFLSDIQKQKDGIRHGVNASAVRLNKMAEKLSLILTMKNLSFHSNVVTCCEWGLKYILDDFESQLRRFKHFEKGENSVYLPSGKKRKNNDGKEGILSDDISDALHMFIFWTLEIFKNPIYKTQKYTFGLDNLKIFD